jgi:hypothetical protein
LIGTVLTSRRLKPYASVATWAYKRPDAAKIASFLEATPSTSGVAFGSAFPVFSKLLKY